MSVAVVDAVGRLIMFVRMDGAKKVKELMSQKKGRLNKTSRENYNKWPFSYPV